MENDHEEIFEIARAMGVQIRSEHRQAGCILKSVMQVWDLAREVGAEWVSLGLEAREAFLNGFREGYMHVEFSVAKSFPKSW